MLCVLSSIRAVELRINFFAMYSVCKSHLKSVNF